MENYELLVLVEYALAAMVAGLAIWKGIIR